MTNTVRIILPAIAIAAITVACVPKGKQYAFKSYEEVSDKFQEIWRDSTANWDEFIKVANILLDSIDVRAHDKIQLRRRMKALDDGFITIDVLHDKYEEMMEAGKPAEYEDIKKLLERIYDVENIWFYDEEDGVPHIWKEHLYKCHRNSDDPVYGYFHIMVTFPCKALPEASLQVFFPNAAEKDPFFTLVRYADDGSANEDQITAVNYIFDEWSRKNERYEGYPMYASSGSDMVLNLLDYDVMYLHFTSETSPEGVPPEHEVSRLDLNPFIDKFTEVWKMLNNQ